MKLLIKIYIVFSFSLLTISAKDVGIIDTVINKKFGTNVVFGQSSDFFPLNIFKLPPESASKDAPANTEEDVCSIGLDGEITLSFKGKIIVNGSGIDFTIFENAFLNPINKKIFAEPAIISVSQDGINFIEFPIDSLTLEGCAGINYTNGISDLFNADVSGGDHFDLDKIGLNYIKYIKIKDFTRFLLNNPKHKFYDPILSGFDLDCIVANHIADDKMDLNENDNFYLSDNLNSVLIRSNQLLNVSIFDYLGNKITENLDNFEIFIDKSKFQTGIYFLKIETNSQTKIIKINVI